ncbi:polyphosphate kinase 1 [Methanospirillum hungatei]|jgi:polyphosphate kinase|uniref:polyphosphate kinase 1 n=1 Tax=Methanospirillum hungatei TaxID=2203 RepID=UPI0009CDD9FC|nr:polyphosphate kinase 1 [Methanospirillum hungatei]MBP7035100.1 polyphosphate kinase 1 [Methanospirillum sp.]MBP9007751.1 polyphosphate kinase 1 [Methanospirillum sp.]OQA59674.1 MAG: polyphosphate kinase [Euryarchaeota archaeon ADurb.Bin294]HOW04071.1 polyphosphate kinase 1 [Methanospirillum hungatei]
MDQSQEPEDYYPDRACSLLSDPALYINRELSWIRFNQHVLDEAKDPTHPLLERIKFLAIFANNLDEFFMVRVSGLHHQLAEGVLKLPPDGLTTMEQLERINNDLVPLLKEQTRVWSEEIIPALQKAGIIIHTRLTLDGTKRKQLRRFFFREIFPVLTPLAFDKSHPFPFISNLALNLAIILKRPGSQEELFARIKIPNTLFPRLIELPADPDGKDISGRQEFIFLEDLIADNLDLLFPGMEIVAAYPFRVTRDADIEIEEDEADDLLSAVEQSISKRWIGTPVRIEIAEDMMPAIVDMMGAKLAKYPHMFYRVRGPVGLADLFCMMNIDRPDLKDTPYAPSVPDRLERDPDIFHAIKQRDIILFHPYESFQPVIKFLEAAAHDPDVLAIKMTLYRTGTNSPIVQALLDAREHGKAVSVLVELKARFDEENNIGWARALERAGAHVVFGIMGLKVHAKLCLVVRKEKSGIVRYVHMSSGNYNAVTAKIYTDIGLFTTNEEIASDVSHLFNVLTGYSEFSAYHHLLVAPGGIKKGITRLIEQEIERQKEHGDGRIIFKLNALQDEGIIRTLYRASQEGVKIHLQVRGICCLRPGIEGISDNITVTTIVGRFLEHTRIYYFHNGGDPLVLMGSSDLMPRNLKRRIEVLYPVLDPGIRDEIINTILPVHLHDTVKTRILQADGSYVRISKESGERMQAQEWLIENRGVWNRNLVKETVR